jgi:hypothetical protein
MCREIMKRSCFPVQNLSIKENVLKTRAYDIGFHSIFSNPEIPSDKDRFPLNLVPV